MSYFSKSSILRINISKNISAPNQIRTDMPLLADGSEPSGSASSPIDAFVPPTTSTLHALAGTSPSSWRVCFPPRGCFISENPHIYGFSELYGQRDSNPHFQLPLPLPVPKTGGAIPALVAPKGVEPLILTSAMSNVIHYTTAPYYVPPVRFERTSSFPLRY